jgi:hypothetical protein
MAKRLWITESSINFQQRVQDRLELFEGSP